ncbi:MAG TPA: PAS domain S-box protein, partial [Acidobacteriaceae bacterium]|nr:PAS domain S-box protein [Acidobacteriaceae bacterium]
MAEIESELSERARDYLQSLQEQYEAANEQIQSTNEELRSINEELERSMEELEAANKELANRNIELNRLNNDLLNLQTSTKLAIIQLDRDLTVQRLSAPAEKQFGLQITDVGRPIGHIQHNLPDLETSETSTPDLESLVKGVIASVHEKALEVRDKAGRWYSLRVTPYVTLDNKVDGAVLVLVDITENKQAEEASVRFAAIVTSFEDAIISKDLNGIIQTWNSGAERIFGYTAQEAIGQPITMLIPEDHHDEEPAILERIRRGERVDHYETIRRRKDGTLADIALTISPILNAQGRISGVSKIARDISERKRMERRIAQQAKDLADMNRRKDEFLAMLSHELRNPMAPIFNALQLIGQAGGESALQHEAYGVIERQMRHMARLVDDLLDVSRITRGRIRLRIERVDVNDVIKQAVERVRHMIDRRGQRLSVSPAPEPVWLDADSARLEQIVGNLLDNATKYSPNGGHIAVSVERCGEQVAVRVRDDGYGIAAEMLPRVFDLFSQADQALDRSQGGLGIGLALIKSLVELHRGSIEVHSDGLRQGSEFVVRLPLALSQTQLAGAASAPPGTEGDACLRVLVVDDNTDAAKTSALLLRSWGYEVRTAHDGPGALQSAVGFRPHVILLDVGLPGMDGYEVVRLLRQDPQFKDVRAVAVTGYGQDSDRQRSMEAGFDHHLVKPVEASDLKALLAGFLPPAT